VAALFDLPAAVGVLGGTIPLIGGHGTAIAWAPDVAQHYGVANAMEIGIACATFGLILASLRPGMRSGIPNVRRLDRDARRNESNAGDPVGS
jgi:sodium--glutamate symport carrier gltS